MRLSPAAPSARIFLNKARSSGVTLIEGLVVLAILGILLGIAAPNLKTPPEQLAANSISSFIQQTKFEAIKRNRPIFVRLSTDGSTLEASLATSAADMSCGFASGSLVRTLVVNEYRGVLMGSTQLPFLWLPNGQPRACGGSPLPLAGVAIDVTGGKQAVSVVVGQQGAVTKR